jgi:twitching motility protein PilT
MVDFKKEIEALIEIAIKEGASDLHITAGRKPTIRVSGELIPLLSQPVLGDEDTKGLLLELLNEENKKKFLDNKDIDFAYESPFGIRFRGNAFFQKGKVGGALRVIPKKIRGIDELNLPPLLNEFAFKEQGFFLVVGPVGQGKSTTLAAMVELINKERSKHILTIEDPIEYIFEGDRSIIDQREVHFDTESFQSALKSMFRQDINVAMIGEMRTAETISTAVTAAETGHLILSTLHTNNAAQTIDRIIDSFPGDQQGQIRVQLASSLIGVFSQRLIPRISGGLIPAYELLINNSAVANLIREGRTTEINVVIETGTESGMIDLNHSLADLVRNGEITVENAIKFSLNPHSLERLL